MTDNRNINNKPSGKIMFFFSYTAIFFIIYFLHNFVVFSQKYHNIGT